MALWYVGYTKPVLDIYIFNISLSETKTQVPNQLRLGNPWAMMLLLSRLCPTVYKVEKNLAIPSNSSNFFSNSFSLAWSVSNSLVRFSRSRVLVR